MSKFTPGPWKLDDEGMHIVGDYGIEPTICEMGTNGEIKPWRQYKNARANAALIAAAPDLLAACEVGEKCLRDLGGYPPEVAAAVCVIIGMMQDAIKKAKGHA